MNISKVGGDLEGRGFSLMELQRHLVVKKYTGHDDTKQQNQIKNRFNTFPGGDTYLCLFIDFICIVLLLWDN